MEVAIRCNSSVPEELRERAEEKVAKLGRFGPLVDHAEVRLSETPSAPVAERASCEVTLRGRGRGHIIRARARAHDAAAAVDMAVTKVAHQLEHMKGKLLGRSRPKRRPDYYLTAPRPISLKKAGAHSTRRGATTAGGLARDVPGTAG
jgi:ribosomal subunit interface protein